VYHVLLSLPRLPSSAVRGETCPPPLPSPAFPHIACPDTDGLISSFLSS